MKTAQELANTLDGEGAMRWWRRLLVFLLVVSFFAFYGLREYRNFSNPESMDMAQLARNIAQGRGYVTDNVRISSMMIVKEVDNGNPHLNQDHPDIVNPPLYPVVLAGLLKAASWAGVSLNYEPQREVVRYLPEVIISIFNQLLLLVAVWLTYKLALKLFDREVAIFAAAMLFLNDMLWKFSISGLPTLLSMVILLLMFHLLVSFRLANVTEDVNDLESIPSIPWTLSRAGLIGFFLAAAALTQYALGWLVIPVLWYVMLTARSSRKLLSGATVLLVFVLLFSPWIVRNMLVSALPFGLATYAPAVETSKLMGDTLERVSTPDILVFYGPELFEYTFKLTKNLGEILTSELPKIGNSWLTMCFFAGIFLPFIRRGLNSTRFLLVVSIFLMAIAQAVCRTYLSDSVPLINSENLLVVFTPLIFVFGAAFIFTMIEQINYELQPIRTIIIWFTGAVLSLPLLFTILPPSVQPLAWPPYHPQTVSRISALYKPTEMISSDMPWAVAWYGRHQNLWVPINPDEEFFKISDSLCPIKGLYLTQLTLDRRFLSELSGYQVDSAWGGLVTRFLARGELPEAFPLRNALGDILPDQMLLSEWDRWRLTE